MKPKLNFDSGGIVPLPTNPGLGVAEINEEKLKRYAAKGEAPSYTLFDETHTAREN